MLGDVLQVRMPAELKARLEDEAAKRYMRPSTLARSMLARSLNEQQRDSDTVPGEPKSERKQRQMEV